jgi:hypothetical protein
MLLNMTDKVPAKNTGKNLSIQHLSPSDENLYGR